MPPAGRVRIVRGSGLPAGYAPSVVHMRIVAPPEVSERALGMLRESESVCNVIWLPGAAQEPAGDVILADVAREDASVTLSDLKELDIHRTGSIALESVETQISLFAERAVERARGSEADAVVWEEVESRTSEQVELSGTYLLFIVLAGLIAAVGIFLNSPILIVGAMVVGPEFGPIAGFCVAVVQRRRHLAARSLVALAAGFSLAITAVYLTTHAFRITGLTPSEFTERSHSLSNVISSPDFFTFFVAACAGVAGMLSLCYGEVGRAHRGADLGHDDPGGSQHRRRRRLRRLARVAWLDRAARDQPRVDHGSRHGDALRSAPAVSEAARAPLAGPQSRGGGAGDRALAAVQARERVTRCRVRGPVNSSGSKVVRAAAESSASGRAGERVRRWPESWLAVGRRRSRCARRARGPR